MTDEKGQLVRAEIPVTGMTCASCVGRVERAFEKVPGVLEANVNLASEKATVRYVAGEVERRDLEMAVEGAGYGLARGRSTLARASTRSSSMTSCWRRRSLH